MPSFKPLYAIAAFSLLSTGVSAGPCRPATSTTLTSDIVSSTTATESATETTSIDSATSTISVEVSTTITSEESTTTSEETTTTTTAEASATASVCFEESTNYFRNPSFEDVVPSEYSAEPWTASDFVSFAQESNGKSARTGDNFVDFDATFFDWTGRLKQQVSGLTEGDSYRLSFWWTATSAQYNDWNGKCQVYIQAGDVYSSSLTSNLKFTYGTYGEYRQMQFEFVASASTIDVNLDFACNYGSSADHFLLDDFSLVHFCPIEAE